MIIMPLYTSSTCKTRALRVTMTMTMNVVVVVLVVVVVVVLEVVFTLTAACNSTKTHILERKSRGRK